MRKTVNYKILPHIGLIVEYYGGDVVADDIIQLKERQLADEAYRLDYNFVVFAQDLVIEKLESDNIEEQIKRYIDYAVSMENVASARKAAILTETPEQVALVTLYQDDAIVLPIEFKIVSTLEATIEWVELSMDYYDEMNAVLKSFRNENI